MRNFLSFLALFAFMSISNGQIKLKGKIIDSKTNVPISYANIGILNTEIGTISNEDGSFFVQIPEENVTSSIIFSSLGYVSQTINGSSFSDKLNIVIRLNEDITELEAIELTYQKKKKKSETYGNGKSLLLSGQLHYDRLKAGSAMALLIEKNNPDLEFISNASLYIAKNLSPKFKVRLRIMSVDGMTKRPGEDLIKEQILKVSDIKKGWLDFDVKELHKITDSSFFLVFEWILNSNDREYISTKYEEYMKAYPNRVSYDTVVVNNERVMIPQISSVIAGTVFGVTKSDKDRENFTCYYRSNSFGEWKISSGILSAKVTLSNQPNRNEDNNKSQIINNENLKEQIDNWAIKFKEKYNIIGLQLSISKSNNTIFSNGYGFSDIQLKKEVNNQTQFRIASVSKTMTAVAIMQLYSKDLLDLNANIQEYVPEFPKKEYPITIRQVAGHLAGIRDYYGKSLDEVFIQKHYNNLSDALELFKNDPLVTKPGANFLYSSFNYTLLGAAIENISKKNYLDYMHHNIWKPLKMYNTYGEVKDSIMPNKSKFYFSTGEEATPYDLSYSYATGGLLSTTDDLVKFGASIINNTIFDSTTKKEMFQNQLDEKEKPVNYGIGWYIGQNKGGEKVYYHLGELPSTSSLLLLYPERNLVIALLTNSTIISESDYGFIPDIQALSKIVSQE
ncbi:serine hydrolase [Flavobacterium sp. J27]|uniref:serine hydrolase n=1 Tax=Flavobacterium sp. J27 TaxID=2060419 RepID=UPI00103238B0|nr:serine hydrolase [Flavobacterium sp. J27]